ncbi:hypothetical protein Vretifemale_8364 [Volvox reticuliferus]|uniref:Uncharacterized protein n=1 Tax=Volvox reticuliferus TaxID=1737510 RepID=A0A8J4CGH6_9CHLO|nr:hypothetical protein Vretifemale_8364 [Volvox reticuliferus]
MMSHQLSRRPSLLPRGMALVSRPVRTVRMQLFRRDGPVLVEENSVEELNQPTKRQREQIKRTLQELGFTEQAADILAYGKITNSNADLLIGDIRASFGIYQAPPPQGPVETVQNGVQDLLDRLRLPFLGLLLAAGLAAAYSQRESLGSLLPAVPSVPVDAVAESVSSAIDDLVVALSGLPGLDGEALANFQDAIDEFLFETLQR